MAPTLSWPEISARRMDRHGLATPLPAVIDAVTAMCGAHAQIPSAAEVSVALRVADTTRSDVAAALWQHRSLVRTFGPRGTVHLLPAAELPTWCAALAAVPRSTGMPPSVRLDAEQTDVVVSAIGAVLDDATLTVEEMDAAVPDRCGAWAGELTMPAFGGFWPRWRQAIGGAAARGVLCFGPNQGRRVTYTNPRRWLGNWPDVRSDVALARLARGYLHAYGPATPAHLAQWLAAPLPWAAELFARLDLDEVVLAGEPAWVNAGDVDVGSVTAAGVRLLPYFDAFVVGSHPRRLLYPGRAADRALAGTQAGNFPVLLVDGVVAGVWHQKRSGKRLVVTVEPIGRLSAAHRGQLAEEVERVAAIQELRAEFTIGAVTVGPHA